MRFRGRRESDGYACLRHDTVSLTSPWMLGAVVTWRPRVLNNYLVAVLTSQIQVPDVDLSQL